MIQIYDTRVAETDIIDPDNYEIMKRYVAVVMADVDVHNIEVPTCKEHRVRPLIMSQTRWTAVVICTPKQINHNLTQPARSEAAMLYLGCIYGFFTKDFVKIKGSKKKIKASPCKCMFKGYI